MICDNKDHTLRRTKIIATLGPATSSLEMIEKIIVAGVNVARINFSHGTKESQRSLVENVRKVSKKLNRVIGILGDLQGPKIRIACFKQGFVEIKQGQDFTLDASFDSQKGDNKMVGIDYKSLPSDVMPDDLLLLDDGRLSMKVKEVKGSAIICEVVQGGKLSNHKGINRLGGGLSAEALTDKDKEDIKLAIDLAVDYLAVSFPRDACDIKYARELVQEQGANIDIIAKIERQEAVENISEIIQVSDGVMIARGDLAVEIGDAEVPVVQRRITHLTRSLNKPVIIATQMMESMIMNSVPTRAETSDVATAVLENSDAVMLSAETATGQYPVKTVKKMAEICLRVEQQPFTQLSKHRVESRFERVDVAVAMATMYTANHLDIKAIIALTESGATTLWMSRIRTGIPIFALSQSKATLGRVTLYRGVYPVEFDIMQSTRDSVNADAVEGVRSLGVLSHGDKVILTKGDFLGVGGRSNAMKILEVGEVI